MRLAILGVVLIAAHAALTAGATVLVQPYQPLPPTAYGRAFVMQMTWLLPIDLMAYLWLGVIAGALRLQDETRRLELRESHLEGDLARAQLEVLRLEIQPHFLFNTLNAISALIRLKANDRALEMLVGLSELMRYTLDRSGDQMMPFEMEVDFIKRYVGIQQARFGDRLRVDFDIADACRTVPLPTFILQPIVENAIRHGAAGVSRPCRIEVRATVDRDATLRVSVRDDGMGLPPGFSLERDAHTGLRNAAARLQRLYGVGAGLSVTPRPGGGTMTEFWLPLRFEAAESATA
jgi:sensor histidine kinase YesM